MAWPSLASGGTCAGTIELDHSTSSGLTTLINSSFTVDGISFSCNGQTGGNRCLVYAPFGPDYFQVLSGTHLFLLEWSQINLAGPYPPEINFFTGYCTTCSGVGNDAVQNGGVGTYVATPESLSQICEMLLKIGVDEYDKDGHKYLQKILISSRSGDQG